MEFSDLHLYSLYSADPVLFTPIRHTKHGLIFFINFSTGDGWDFVEFEELEWKDLDFYYKTLEEDHFFHQRGLLMAFFENKIK